VEQYFPDWKPAESAVAEQIDVLNNTSFDVLGEITIDWFGINERTHSPAPKFRGKFRAKTCSTTFSVAKDYDFPCDVILGQPTIHNCSLLKDCCWGTQKKKKKKGEIAARKYQGQNYSHSSETSINADVDQSRGQRQRFDKKRMLDSKD